jgi:hypothetical protein
MIAFCPVVFACSGVRCAHILTSHFAAKTAVKAASAKVVKKAADAKEKNFQTALDEKATKDAGD